MTVARAAFWLALLPSISGCVVLSSTYEAEVQRNRELSEQVEMNELQIEELARRIEELQASEETLQLEHESLSEERLTLLQEIEDTRSGNEKLREQLEAEQRVRALREADIQEISGTYSSLIDNLEKEIEAGKVEIYRLKGRIQVRASEKILFDSGSATLKTEGRGVLARLAAELGELPAHRIRVEGHTDDIPIATALYPSNWELSGARAAGVTRFLLEHGVDATRVEAVGVADQQPIASNDTAEGRARNRRIEIVLVPEALD